MKLIYLALLIPFLTGCPAISEALKDYDRSFVAVANVNEQTGAVEYEIRPAAKKGEGSLGGKIRIEGTLADGKQVIRLEK